MYTRVLFWLVPFTKAQRLKGLKKQLRNLGYEVTKDGAPVRDAEEKIPVDDVPAGERGRHAIASMQAASEGW